MSSLRGGVLARGGMAVCLREKASAREALPRRATVRLSAVAPAIATATTQACAVPGHGWLTLAARTRCAATPTAVPS